MSKRMSDERFDEAVSRLDAETSPTAYGGQCLGDVVDEARRARESEAAALALLERLYTAEPEFEPWDEVYPMMIKAGRI